jgi:hypothetical protein
VTGALGEGSVGIRTYTHIRGEQLEFCRLELYIDGTEHRVFSEGNEYYLLSSLGFSRNTTLRVGSEPLV